MGRHKIWARNQAMTLYVTVNTNNSEQIRVIVSHASQDNTVFADRFREVNGQFKFILMLPLTAPYINLDIYNEANGNIINDSSFTYSIDFGELERRLDVFDFKDPLLFDFIKFNKKFAYNAGWLPVGAYRSASGNFIINYLDDLTDINDQGQEVSVPTTFRIDLDTKGKGIEACRPKIVPYTVPGRFALAMHEYAHCYMNDDPENEVQADLNGITVCLGLGFPRIDVIEAFVFTFEGNPTAENDERIQIIQDFVENFDQSKILLSGY